jgi:hypothetical protein
LKAFVFVLLKAVRWGYTLMESCRKGREGEFSSAVLRQMSRRCGQRVQSSLALLKNNGCEMDNRRKLFWIIIRSWRISCCHVKTMYCRKGREG